MQTDVAIVGFGPVGQMLAGLLGQAGHRVTVFERFTEPYPLPRAVHFDAEAMRMFQRLGIAEAVREDAVPGAEYFWYGSDGELILTLLEEDQHPSGWHPDWLFFQPRLERLLIEAAQRQPSVELRRGWTAQTLDQDGSGTRLTVSDNTSGEVEVVTARYIVGADGANSMVRQQLAIDWEDLGFAEQWFVCDVRPHQRHILEDLPMAAQYCDPARPHVTVRNGRDHRRWEFQLLPGEDPADFRGDPGRAWELLNPYVNRDEADLLRHTTYQFRSLLATTMQSGRVFLAGDAAHLMPPFLGQGMCSGLRDACNLSWKLDQALMGRASSQLLETYTPERRAQNEAMVRMSLLFGQVACILDPVAAERRDGAFRRGEIPPPPAVPGIGPGVTRRGADDRPVPPAGALAVQGRVRYQGTSGWFDDVLGSGFSLICREGDPGELLGADHLEFLASIGAVVCSLDATASSAIEDLDGRLTRWMEDLGLAAVIARPDFYSFGGVSDAADLPALVTDLRRHWS